MMIHKRNPSRLEPLYDTIVGDGDDETLTGTESRDLIRGLGGEDVLVGLGGGDRLEGGERADTLTGGKGRDTLIGGKRDDVYRFETVGDSRPGKADTITIFRGGDALDLSAIDADKGAAGNQDFTHVAALTGVAGQLAFSSDGGNGTIVEGDVDGDGAADIRIEISRDDRDTLAGTDGDDTLIGYDENEGIGGGEGNDMLLGGGGDDGLGGGDGNDTVLGGTGHDDLFGGDGDDLLEGGIGSDTLDGDDGDDTVLGGDGDDLISGNLTGGSVPEVDSLDGGAGDDSIDGSGFGGSGDDTILGRFCFGGSGNDSLLGRTTVGNMLDGGEDDDTLIGGDSNNQGDDTLIGGSGNDYLDGSAGNDILDGGLGGDTIDPGHNPDTLIYNGVADSTASNPDLITKLNDEKTIDLSAIDADSLVAGDQAFSRVPDFSGAAGELRLRYDSGSNRTFIEGDVDGDAVADLVILVTGDKTDFTSFEM